MPERFLVARFSSQQELVRAADAVRAERFRIFDAYAPYPIHELGRALGTRRSRLPRATLVAGAAALAFAVAFQFYTATLDWNLDVGGKPDNSLLAFIPICFELTVLLGGLATVAALFLRAGLFPGKQEALAAAGVTDDSFALVLKRRNPSFRSERAAEILIECGAIEIRESEAAL